jgi:hypothetical protein
MQNSSNFLANQLHILLIILASFFAQQAVAQDSTYTTYLAKNNEKITIGSNNSFSLLDKAFYSNELFLLTESHGYAKPHQLDAELFKQLNKKTGVRYYLAEIDFAQAHYLNQYLNTGNEDFLKSIYKYWFDTKAQWGCKAGFEKWKNLYNYNKTLAKDKKIIVLGLDNAQDLTMNVKLLSEILSTSRYKKSTNVMLDSLLNFSAQNLLNDSTRTFIKFTRRLMIAIEKDSAKYKKALKNNYTDFYFIVNNIAAKKDRETKIFYNFTVFYNRYKLASQKMYGFWGRFHGMQDSINGGLSFSAMLKKTNLPLHNKIISIPVFCVESASMLPTAYLPPMAQEKGKIFSKVSMVNDDSFIYSVNGIKNLRKFVGKDENVLFKLNGISSPYNSGLNLVESSSKFDKTFNWAGNKNSTTTDYFQYCMVVSNSDWAEPYGDNNSK